MRTPPWSPRSGATLVAVGAAAHCRCAYSRYPRYRIQKQPHPGGVQQNAESTACSTPPGCDIIGQSIPWVARIRATHGYQYYTTPWCDVSRVRGAVRPPATRTVVPALCAGSGADRRIPRLPRAWRCPHPATRSATSPWSPRSGATLVAAPWSPRSGATLVAAPWSPRSGATLIAVPWSPRSGATLVAVGCAYSRYPRYRMQNQPHPGGVQQHAESTACCTPPGCDIIGQSIPWVARIRATHGYQYYTTPWCGNSMTSRQDDKPTRQESLNAAAARRFAFAPVLSSCRLVVLSSCPAPAVKLL